MSFLDVKNLSVVFETDDGVLKAVDDVSFTISKGETVGLVGESGSGKSVTALSIPRLIPSPPGKITAGEIYFKGKDLLQSGARELRRIRGNAISMIFQEPLSALSPLHRVGRQMVEALRFHRDLSEKDARAHAAEWLKKVRIPEARERMYAYPFQLSGGMQQRIMIAMAMMLSPKLVIADEPTTALDVTTQAQIFSLLRDMKQNASALLLITHDMGAVWEMCDRVLVMYASQIVESAPLNDIFTVPAHPYTMGLLEAIPRLSTGPGRLRDIPGQVPSPLRYPPACRFQDRCPYVFDRCREEMPVLTNCGENHFAACFKVY